MPEATIPEDEYWVSIPGFENYEISNLGRIKSLVRDKIMATYPSHNGYYHLPLSMN